MVCGDVVPHLEAHRELQAVRERSARRARLDIWAAEHLDGSGLFRRSGRENRAVVDREMLRETDIKRREPQRARVCDLSGQRRGHSGLGRDEENLRVTGTAAPLKVAVESTQTYTAGIGRKTHPDAGTAGALEQASTGSKDIRKRAAVGEHPKDLLGARRDRHTYGGRNGPAAKHGRRLEHIVERGVRAGAEAYLVDLCTLKGIYSVGDLNQGTWENLGSEHNYTLSDTPTELTYNGSNQPETVDVCAYLFLPQELGPNAAISVGYNIVQRVSGTDYTLENTPVTIPLGSSLTQWEPGKKYIYTLNIGMNNVITFTASTVGWQDDGDNIIVEEN